MSKERYNELRENFLMNMDLKAVEISELFEAVRKAHMFEDRIELISIAEEDEYV